MATLRVADSLGESTYRAGELTGNGACSPGASWRGVAAFSSIPPTVLWAATRVGVSVGGRYGPGA